MACVKIDSLEKMKQFGEKLGSLLRGGEIITLNGDLGAGKTEITKSIAKSLLIEDYITSPTFTIVNEYEGRLKLNHFDVYRLESSEDMYDLGYEEYFYSDGVSVIEWAEIISDILPRERLDLYIKRTEKEEEREIELVPHGESYEKIAEELIR
jgi:tRNA threonylcarbamoyladenosine biosynthesis protein TsaE